MKKIIPFFYLFLPIVLLGQGSFKLEVDYARYLYNDTSAYLEIYYSFYQNQLRAVQEGNHSIVKGYLNVNIKDKITNVPIVDREWQFTRELADTLNGINGKSLIGILGFQMPFGNYVCTIFGKDVNNTTSFDSVTFDLKIHKIPTDRFSISDIELVSLIKRAEEVNKSIFYKNTYEVIPNPHMIFGVDLPVLYFYAELYNLLEDKKSDVLKVEYILLSAMNKEQYRKVKYIPRKNYSVVDVGAINISKIPSGTYTLILAISDTLKNHKTSSSKRVFIYNPNVIDSALTLYTEKDIMASEFSIMNEEELNDMFGMIKYISTVDELGQWNKITNVEGKRNFLFNFWKKRDPDPLSAHNEFKIQYLNNVEYVNSHYSTIQKKGWRTDRGRVYLSYGAPTEIERFPNQIDTKPYEIWKYNQLEGGVIFIFADLTGFNDYLLVNSTLRGELRDDNWVRRINVR